MFGLKTPSTIVLLAGTLLCAVGCQDKAPPAPKPVESAPQSKPGTQAASQNFAEKLEGKGTKGLYHFKLTMKPSQPKLNEMFRTEVLLTDATTGEPITGATVKVDASMPEHRHGMMTAPTYEELGEGRYLTKGMKLHMHGSWEVKVDADTHAGADHLDWRYNQKPIAKE